MVGISCRAGNQIQYLLMTYKGTGFEERMTGSFCYALDPSRVL